MPKNPVLLKITLDYVLVFNLKICQTSSKLSFCFEENISMVVALNHILYFLQNLIMHGAILD